MGYRAALLALSIALTGCVAAQPSTLPQEAKTHSLAPVCYARPSMEKMLRLIDSSEPEDVYAFIELFLNGECGLLAENSPVAVLAEYTEAGRVVLVQSGDRQWFTSPEFLDVCVQGSVEYTEPSTPKRSLECSQ